MSPEDEIKQARLHMHIGEAALELLKMKRDDAYRIISVDQQESDYTVITYADLDEKMRRYVHRALLADFLGIGC